MTRQLWAQIYTKDFALMFYKVCAICRYEKFFFPSNSTGRKKRLHKNIVVTYITCIRTYENVLPALMYREGEFSYYVSTRGIYWMNKNDLLSYLPTFCNYELDYCDIIVVIIIS